jgi:hypothetical protein
MQFGPLLSCGMKGGCVLLSMPGEQMSKHGVTDKGTLYLPLTSNEDWLGRRIT